jgi:uncharacterized protein YggE
MNTTFRPAYRGGSVILAHRSRRRRSRLAAVGAAAAIAAVLVLGGAALNNEAARPAHAQEAGAPRSSATDAPRSIAVLGEGVARVKPDAITLRLGVEVLAQTPAAALARARENSERVLQRLRDLGVPESDLQTTGFNVFRIQDGPPAPGQQPPSSYRGYASLGVKVGDVARAGTILEAAMQAGATALEGLNYGLRDDSQLRLVAIADAVRAARPRAEAAASAAGLRLGSVRAVAELDPMSPVRPAMGGGTEGVAPGEIEVLVRVNVTFDVL